MNLEQLAVNENERLSRYADLVVNVGLGLRPKQPLLINAFVEHIPLVRTVTRAAYAAGSGPVDVRYDDIHALKARVELGREETLDWTPDWLVRRVRDVAAQHGAVLRLTSPPDSGLLSALDGGRLARARMAGLEAAMLRVVAEKAVSWCVFGCPTEAWAETLFGAPDLDRLWEALERAVRLDQPDPLTAWRKHLAWLGERAATLNRRSFDAIRFRGPGTNLTVGLLAGSRWQGGASKTSEGQIHVPNLPTEEVFTTPDLRRVEGMVRSTRPLIVNGVMVENLCLKFANGRVVQVEASRGADFIRSLIASDKGASQLGEVALVDGSSRVGQLGLTFHETLLDENATCHLALGAGFPYAVEGAANLSQEDLADFGVNVSGIHVDFMVGGPEVEVDALELSGAAVPLLRDNQWGLP
jgi:aminopeptidase